MTTPTKFWMVKGDGPAIVPHGSRAVAESEAERLARLHPGTPFFVLEAVACHRRVDVERISLDGKGDPRADPEIPF